MSEMLIFTFIAFQIFCFVFGVCGLIQFMKIRKRKKQGYIVTRTEQDKLTKFHKELGDDCRLYDPLADLKYLGVKEVNIKGQDDDI